MKRNETNWIVREVNETLLSDVLYVLALLVYKKVKNWKIFLLFFNFGIHHLQFHHMLLQTMLLK